MAHYNSVMLVDDDGITNFLNKRLLSNLGLSNEIIVTTDGAEALAHLKDCLQNGKKCPELILLDINMPLMNGFEFLIEFEKLNSPNNIHATIVMLTTSTHQNDMLRMKNHRVSGFLNKPLTTEKVNDLLVSLQKQSHTVLS